MGVLSDIIIADRTEATSINAAEGNHLKQWDCLESKGIDTIKLGSLSRILAGRSLDDVPAVPVFMDNSLLDKYSDDGPWVYLVPDQLVSALAALDDDAEETVAASWAEIEEFRLSRWQPMDVQEYLHDLIEYARKARDQGKSLLLWMSV